MARIFTTGAESGAALTESVTLTGTVTFGTTTKRSGARAYKFDSGSGSGVAAYATSTLKSSSNGQYFRGYFYITAYPPSNPVAILGNSTVVSGTDGFELMLWPAGDLILRNRASGSTLENFFPTLQLNTWTRLEMRTSYGTGATDLVEVKITPDGGSTLTSSLYNTENAGTATVLQNWWWGIEDAFAGTNFIIYVDDVALNDTTAGTGQTAYPGAGKVVQLLPISDNARATLWVGGGGGLTNLWDAVNNTPPVGIASGNNTSQIEHTGGAAGTTDSYDAIMTTYTTAGVGSSDTVMVTQYLIAHGEDVATGTKLLNMQLVSNPTDTISSNFTAGNDAGQASTFPTLWVVNRNGYLYQPSVTKGTSPVARVRRPETASRTASVCFMAVVVEYAQLGTPGGITATVCTATTQSEAAVLDADVAAKMIANAAPTNTVKA